MPLTDKQKTQVAELRCQKHGYGSIANALGVKRDQVRDYCRTKQFTGQRATVKAAPKKCRLCGVEYYTSSTWRSTVYCGVECKEKASFLRKKRTIEKRKAFCLTCGKEFIRKNGKQAYCSYECSHVVKNCKHCGRPFTTHVKSGQLFCGRDCFAKNNLKSHNEYCERFFKIHKGALTPVTKYNGANNNITAYCLECGQTTKRKASLFIDNSRRRGCRHCGKTLSVGELMVEEWLKDKKINYTKQYSIRSLLDQKPLRFDFAVRNKGGCVIALIEYNGRQHYEPVDQFGGVVEFNKQIHRDEMKKQYAHTNGIKFVVINYKEKNNIGQILSEAITNNAPSGPTCPC